MSYRYVFFGGSLHGQEREGQHAGARYYINPIFEDGPGSAFIASHYPLRGDTHIRKERYRRKLAWDEAHENVEHVQWHYEGDE